MEAVLDALVKRCDTRRGKVCCPLIDALHGATQHVRFAQLMTIIFPAHDLGVIHRLCRIHST